jgi:predicted metal-dependent phosphoesterase TrpH
MEFDLHIHSKYSYDSLSEPAKIVKAAKKKGLSGIAITDHNSIKGGLEALKYADDEFLVIVGEEVATDEGEIIGLFLKEELKSRSALTVIKEIRNQGGISILAHPYKRTSRTNMEIIKEIDAVEGFNSRGKRLFSGDKNRLALELAQKHNLPLTAGSDAHFLFEIGRARCIMEEGLSAEEVKRAILNGKAKISGKVSSIFVELFSQLIKMIKLKQPLLFLKGVSKLIYRCLPFKRGD